MRIDIRISESATNLRPDQFNAFKDDITKRTAASFLTHKGEVLDKNECFCLVIDDLTDAYQVIDLIEKYRKTAKDHLKEGGGFTHPEEAKKE